MPKPVSSEPFYALMASLKASGFATHATRLEEVLNGVWTTSTELIGELGTVVYAVRAECKPLTSSQKQLVRACLKEVRKAWPGFGLFSEFPFRW
jgi:hypothetical protein